MTQHIVLSALEPHGLRPTGRDRYRAICPSCGDRNPNTLAVRVTAEGAVLLSCYKLHCDVESICAVLGLEVSDLFPARDSSAPPLKRRRLITDAQALNLLHDETHFVGLCAANIGNGIELSPDDRARCIVAAGRIAYLRDEVRA